VAFIKLETLPAICPILSGGFCAIFKSVTIFTEVTVDEVIERISPDPKKNIKFLKSNQQGIVKIMFSDNQPITWSLETHRDNPRLAYFTLHFESKLLATGRVVKRKFMEWKKIRSLIQTWPQSFKKISQDTTIFEILLCVYFSYFRKVKLREASLNEVGLWLGELPLELVDLIAKHVIVQISYWESRE